MSRRLAPGILVCLLAAGLRADGESLLALGGAQTKLDEAEALLARGCLENASTLFLGLSNLTGPGTAHFRGRAARGTGLIELVRSRNIETARGPLMLSLSLGLETGDRGHGRALASALVKLAKVEAATGNQGGLGSLRKALVEVAQAGGLEALGSAFFVGVAPAFRSPPERAGLRTILETAIAGHQQEPEAPLVDRVEARGELARLMADLGDREAAAYHMESIFPFFADGSYFAARIQDLSFFDHPLKSLGGMMLKSMPGIAKLGERKMLARLAEVYASMGLPGRAKELAALASPPEAAPGGAETAAPAPAAASPAAAEISPPPPDAGEWEKPLATVASLMQDAPALASLHLERVEQSVGGSKPGAEGRARALERSAELKRGLEARRQGEDCDQPVPIPTREPPRRPVPAVEEPLGSWLY